MEVQYAESGKSMRVITRLSHLRSSGRPTLAVCAHEILAPWRYTPAFTGLLPGRTHPSRKARPSAASSCIVMPLPPYYIVPPCMYRLPNSWPWASPNANDMVNEPYVVTDWSSPYIGPLIVAW